MPDIFFTSDTHFGHASMVTKGWRPQFASLEDMDEHLIGRWNETVGPRDTVYHLGDFTTLNGIAAQNYARRLNGNIHLIWGNHDRNATRNLPIWQSSQYVKEVSIQGTTFVLCHFAMRVWNKSHHGSIMLFGHSHGTLPGNSQSMDVGVDANNFRPIEYFEVVEKLKTLPAFCQQDHHKQDF